MIQQHARPMYDQRKWAMGKIHEVADRLKIDDASRRSWQRDLVGVESCKDMDVAQLKKVLWALTHKTKADKPARTTTGLTPIGSLVESATGKLYRLRSGRDERMPDEPITIEQQRMLEHLFLDIETLNPGRLERTWRSEFCKRQCRRVWPQSRAQANKIIEALKSMRDRGWRPKEKAQC